MATSSQETQTMTGRSSGRIPPLSRRRLRRRLPRGVVTLVLILALPAWLILLAGVVEFGLILVNQQQVALASRVGAEAASQTPGLPTVTGGQVPANVLNAIDQQLASTGIGRCKVILEHNVVGEGPSPTPVPVTLSSPQPAGCNCGPPSPDLLPDDRLYVRVTVYVPLTELSPNLLKISGFDISGMFLQQATTFRYEL